MRISDWSSDVCSSDLGDDDAAIARWLRRVDDADDTDYREEKNAAGKDVTVNYTGTKSVFVGAPAGGERRALQVTPPGGGKQFVVSGIPLAQKGFHVVQIAGPELGRSLLGRQWTSKPAHAPPPTNTPDAFTNRQRSGK